MTIGIVLACSIVLTGCANNDKETSTKQTNEGQVAGQPTADASPAPAANNGNSQNSANSASPSAAASTSLVGKWEGQTEIYEFFADGTGAITFKPHVPKDDVGKITWSGSTVQIGRITGNATFSADGRTLTLTDPKTGYASKFTRIR